MRRFGDTPAIRIRQQLTAEADAEDRNAEPVGIAHLLDLGQHPGPDEVMVVGRPRGTHEHDRIEVDKGRQVRFDSWRVMQVLGDDLVQFDVIAVIGEPISDRTWRRDVVMLDDESAHAATVDRLRSDPKDRRSGSQAIPSEPLRPRSFAPYLSKITDDRSIRTVTYSRSPP